MNSQTQPEGRSVRFGLARKFLRIYHLGNSHVSLTFTKPGHRIVLSNREQNQGKVSSSNWRVSQEPWANFLRLVDIKFEMGLNHRKPKAVNQKWDLNNTIKVSRLLLHLECIPLGPREDSLHPKAWEALAEEEGSGAAGRSGHPHKRMLSKWATTELMCFCVSLTRFTSGRSGIGVPCPIASLYFTYIKMRQESNSCMCMCLVIVL